METSVEEDDSDLILQPLDLTDINRNHDNCSFVSQPSLEDTSPENSQIFSVAMGLARRGSTSSRDHEENNASSWRARQQWKEAVSKALRMEDPWAMFHLEKLKTEMVIRYRYNALRKLWVTDNILVKMDKEPFARGAMRECYRLKKLSKFCHRQNRTGTSNYVAKQYIDSVDREVYFEDIKLQMDAKLWSEEYNRHNPPKKVDIFQVSAIEFVDRPDKPIFHLEHFIEGDYMKYNSNSGFISCENVRLTPQAFSHFTFERSGHELIVVDIQGVGDLYTDPQIHTSSGIEYGDGNLGTRGMALFFHSHACNRICESLGLTPFDLSTSEKAASRKLVSVQKSSETCIRGTEELCITPSQYERTHLVEFLRQRCQSLVEEWDDISGNCRGSPSELPRSLGRDSGFRSLSCGSDDANWQREFDFDEPEDDMEEETQFRMSPGPDSGVDFQKRERRMERRRCDSECSVILNENDKQEFQEMVALRSRPSCIHQDVEFQKFYEDNGSRSGKGSILGQIHLEMARCHELGRFKPDYMEDYDHDDALFHLEHAAQCANLEAISTMWRVYLQLPHDLLTAAGVPNIPENVEKGLHYMLLAARAGDRAAMICMARAHEMGEVLGNPWERCWKRAVYWYNRAVMTEEVDEGGEYDGCVHDPNYQLLAQQAEMYRNGGYGLEKDVSKAAELYQAAAEVATAAMKGRLANKYYMLAEEVNG